MGLFDGLTRLFRKEAPLPEPEFTEGRLPEEIPPSFNLSGETPALENVRVKMDLIATHLDTLRTQYQVLNGKLDAIEKMVKEMYAMAKS